ncbi:MAG: diacylglycerol kinase family lipid kinase [Clostridiales bacterium]|nr:diacylglycerol kinase family lipid kinase [Clostridiales bacterium]
MSVYHILSNPTAGKNRAIKNLKKVEEILRKKGVAYEVHLSKAEKDAEKIVRELTEAGETEIIVIGGDGTLHEALNGIADVSACRLGLIPSGTGNDFAENLGLPKKVEDALDLILNGEARETDYVDVGGVRCMNVAGVGMDVDVLERCQRGRLKGKIKYLLSLIRSLFAFKGYQVEMQSGDRKETYDVLLAAVCNGSQFGGGVRICPVADSTDGKLNAVFVARPGGKWKIIKAFISLMKGKILEKPITTAFLCEEIKIIPKTKCAMQLDGELYKEYDFTAKVCKGLRFYRP